MLYIKEYFSQQRLLAALLSGGLVLSYLFLVSLGNLKEDIPSCLA